MTEYTRGPWRLIEPNEKIHWPIVQRKDTGGFIVMTEDVDVSCADARLISAAPDMLEALEELKKWIEDECGAELPSDKADAAIAKAKGQ